MIFLFLTFTPFLLIGVRILKWVRNYFRARSYGLPIIFLPVSFNEPLWMLFRPLFAWVQYLPLGLGNWYLYTTMGWPTEDGNRTSLRLGENFVLCSPVDNVVVTCEPAVASSVWEEKKYIWRVPESQSQLFTFFGQNVSSTHGEDWKRHRRVTVQAFSERMMERVWCEARRRANALSTELGRESVRSLGRIRTTFDVLAMQVLAIAAFGQESELVTVPPGHKQSLMESLGFILKHVLLTVVFQSLKVSDFLLPNVLRQLKRSVAEVRLYMEELVLVHMQSSTPKSSTFGSLPTSLLSAMITANEIEKQESSEGKPRSYLTVSELYGNIFVFNLAGYETTSSSLTFALPFLALHPEVQTWIAEEVDAITSSDARCQKSRDKPEEGEVGLGYSEIYSQMVRTKALMYETLRLASPAPLLVKTSLLPVDLDITTATGLRTITVHPGTLVGFNQYAAHLSPRWGDEAEVFDPKRFVTEIGGEERFKIPDGPMYAAWMIGPRVCPAKKFSQVEFIGIMTELLRNWRVELVREDGESEGEVRQRVKAVLMDEKYFNVSAHLKRPDAAHVRFVPRPRD